MPEGGGDDGLDSDFPGTVWISMSLGVGFCAEDVLWGPAISGNKHAPWALDKVLPSLPPPATIPPPPSHPHSVLPTGAGGLANSDREFKQVQHMRANGVRQEFVGTDVTGYLMRNCDYLWCVCVCVCVVTLLLTVKGSSGITIRGGAGHVLKATAQASLGVKNRMRIPAQVATAIRLSQCQRILMETGVLHCASSHHMRVRYPFV